MNWIEYRITQAKTGKTTELDLNSGFSYPPTGPADVLTKLPREILDLKHLTKLDLSGHGLKTLPPEICQLENLRELNLDANVEITLPEELGRLPHLRRLSLGSVKSAVNFPFSRLRTLESLKLFGTPLKALPEEILALENLAELDLRWSPFEVFPKDLKRLRSLRSLSFGMYACDVLAPGDLARLARDVTLKDIDLYSVSNPDVLEEISEFSMLEKLTLRDVRLEAIPEGWLRLPLRSLSLRGREPQAEIKNIAAISRLAQLKELTLSRTQLGEAMSTILKLKQLATLRLDHVGLSGFPGELVESSELENLSLTGAGIAEVPKSIGRLQKLKTLNLSDNPIRELPEEIGSLQGLTSLWLYGTRLEGLPQAVRKLKALTRINLGNAPLRRWPDELNELTALEWVGLENTGITEIPAAAIRSLPLLKRLAVSENLITVPPPEIVARGTAAIQGYFRALEESKTSRLYEAKMIVVGEGDVGKTCVARKLVDPDFDIEQNRDKIATTPGIAIEDWRVETDVTKSFRVNIWDFGGQEIYRVIPEIASYYGMISHLDEQIGRMLGTPDETGLARNTIVVFSADNGLAVGCHGLLGKSSISTRKDHAVPGPGPREGALSYWATSSR